MNRQKFKALGQIGLAGLLAVGCVLSVPTAGSAHVVRKDSWTMHLEAAPSGLNSDLLTAEGQNVQLNELSDWYQIEIPVMNRQDEAWVMTAVSRSPEYMTATLSLSEDSSSEDSDELFYYPDEAEEPDRENSDAGAEEELEENEEEGMQIVYLNLTTVAEKEEEEPPTEEAEPPSEETEETLPSASETTEETDSDQEGAVGAEEDTAETEEENSAEEDAAAEAANTVRIEVTLTYGMEETDEGEFDEETGKTISATFHLPLNQNQPEKLTGTLENCPSQYNPEAAIPLMTGEKGCELKLDQAENKEFPAMTRYTIGSGRTWVLYDGGTIQIPAQTAFTLDISLTELNPKVKPKEEIVTYDQSGEQAAAEEEDILQTEQQNLVAEAEERPELVLKAGTNTHNLGYVDVPEAKTVGKPFVITDDYVVLPIPYLWGNIAPAAATEQLKQQDGRLVWESVEDMFYIEPTEASNEIKVMKTGPAEAGTYQITISWVEDGMELYSLKTVFYLQYGNAG